MYGNHQGMFDDSEWQALEELRDLLWETFPMGDDVTDWLTTPSPFLQGVSPLEALQDGRISMVREVLEDLSSDL